MSGRSWNSPAKGHAGAVVLRHVGHAWVGVGADRQILSGVDIVLEGGRVTAIGDDAVRPEGARVIDASNWLVLPGLVNAHHHLTQQLTRTLTPAGNVFDWLAECYPKWARLTAETALPGARIGLAELLLAGVTTTADLSYFFPRGRGDIYDAQVQAATDLGIRILAIRGGMRDVGAEVRSMIGGKVDAAIEPTETLLTELERVTGAYHDADSAAMVKVGVGLTEPLWDEPRLMRELAEFADRHALGLHTHLHPRPSDRDAHPGPGVSGALEELGWWHDRLWVAHGTNLSDDELSEMQAAGVALASCPSSNARLATPIAPTWKLHRLGGTVALGVDGAASSDSGDLLGEARLAWQLQRIASRGRDDAGLLTPRVVLEWATSGGAAALGWPGLGELSTGGLADLACFDLSGVDFVGADDPLDALILCGLSHRASLVVVCGRIVVEDGHLTTTDEAVLAADGKRAAAALRL